MEHMKEITRYQCQYCKKDFKTPNRHYCKFKPELKNCFTCNYLKGWLESDEGVDVGVGILYNPNYPDCVKDYGYEWDIESIKSCNYNMQCDMWEEGKFDWSKECD